MKKVFQTKFGFPKGNCFNACVASILECDIEDLPDLNEIEQTGENWLIGLNAYLKKHCIGLISITATPGQPANVYIPDGCFVIVSGDGPRGLKHSVIYQQRGDDFVFIHDPLPQGDGLSKPESIQMVVKLGL